MRPADLHRLHDGRAGRAALSRPCDEPSAADAGGAHSGPLGRDLGQDAYVTQVLIALEPDRLHRDRRPGSGDQRPRRQDLRAGLLFGPAVADGDWWRLITSAFLHATPPHRLQHARALVVRRPVELSSDARVPAHLLRLGTGRTRRCSADVAERADRRRVGRDLRDPRRGLVLERQACTSSASALAIIIVDIVFSLAVPGISIGGHIGGLVGEP